MKTNHIANYIRAGYSGLYLVSHEEQRIAAEMQATAAAVGFAFYTWSLTSGIVKPHAKPEQIESIPDTAPPGKALAAFGKLPEKSVLLLRDFHMILRDPNPLLYRMVKDALNEGKASNRVLAILGCQLHLPPELEKEITVIDYKLPDREQLLGILEAIAAGAKVKLNGNTEKIIDAASGLTTTEAENAFALSVVEAKDISPEIVSREKSHTVKKNGLLEIVESGVTLEDIGGLENLTADLLEQRNLFTKEAREYGLPAPRGKLIVGQPGTGKSLTASATKAIFNLPLVRLEAGRLFGSLVGESERNWRNAFATVKAIAPCIFWIDEVDGLFKGGESSGRTDGGTTARVIKAILQDMQFNGEGIFFFFTANDIDGLPDPLIDRLDVWSVDLPNATERADIWNIHITKRGRKPAKFDLDELARLTDGFSGRQIEQVWLKSMTRAFNLKREPAEADVAHVCKSVVPTSVTMKEQIEARRTRLKNRATPASAPETKTASGRKIAK